MTPDFLPIYCTSILTVGLLAAFARHNKATGWQKQRGKAANWFASYYQNGSEDKSLAGREIAGEAQTPEIPAWTPVSAPEAISFSAQLIRMRTALGAAGNAPAVETIESERAFAHK